MSHNIAEIELLLGAREQYTLAAADSDLLREWARLRGFHPFDVQRMSLIELTNLYTGPRQEDNSTHEWLVRVLEAVNAPGFEVSLTRRIARAEMQAEILSGETVRSIIQDTLERLAPRSLVVQTPHSAVKLDGLLHYATEDVIKIVAMNHPLMMVGPAGCGKTTIAEHTAKALSLDFYITSTINDTHELMGFVDGHGKYHSTAFRQAFEYGGLWVADEIDAWDASALLAANSALANGYATVPDCETPVSRSPSFRMVATANTFGNGADRVYIGRNELDAASLDRFATLNVDYDLNLERMFAAGNIEWLEYVWSIRKKIIEKKIRHVASSRAIAKGAEALANGLAWNSVVEWYLMKGISAADRSKLE